MRQCIFLPSSWTTHQNDNKPRKRRWFWLLLSWRRTKWWWILCSRKGIEHPASKRPDLLCQNLKGLSSISDLILWISQRPSTITFPAAYGCPQAQARDNGSSNRACGFSLRRKLLAKGMPLQRPPVLWSEVNIATTLWRTNKSSWPWLHIMRTPWSWWLSCLLCCKKKGPPPHPHRQVGAAGPQEDRQHHCPSQVNSEDKSAVVKSVQANRTSNNDIHNNLGRCFPGSKISGWHCQPWKGKGQKLIAKLGGMSHAYCWVF